MKKLGLAVIAALLLASADACAQEKKITFGVKAGLNVTRFLGYDAYLNSGYLAGLNTGLTVDIRLGRQFWLMTGLEYSQKGHKNNVLIFGGSNGLSVGKETSRLNYLQIPARIAIGNKIPGSKNVYARFYAGPYLAAGISGKTTLTANGMKYERNSFSSNMFRRFDCGIGLGAGVDFGHIAFNVGYDAGFVHISDNTFAKKQLNFAFNTTVGYKF